MARVTAGETVEAGEALGALEAVSLGDIFLAVGTVYLIYEAYKAYEHSHPQMTGNYAGTN